MSEENEQNRYVRVKDLTLGSKVYYIGSINDKKVISSTEVVGLESLSNGEYMVKVSGAMNSERKGISAKVTTSILKKGYFGCREYFTDSRLAHTKRVNILKDNLKIHKDKLNKALQLKTETEDELRKACVERERNLYE